MTTGSSRFPFGNNNFLFQQVNHNYLSRLHERFLTKTVRLKEAEDSEALSDHKASGNSVTDRLTKQCQSPNNKDPDTIQRIQGENIVKYINAFSEPFSFPLYHRSMFIHSITRPKQDGSVKASRQQKHSFTIQQNVVGGLLPKSAYLNCIFKICALLQA